MRDVTSSLKLGVAERDRLRAGAAELGVTLDDVAVQRFAAYADLLDRWRRTTNLVSCRNAEELVDRHLVDALACSWLCGEAPAIADLGSGAGLPGVPLTIVHPGRRTVLVEPRRRRASFLRDVKRELRLEHVEVLEIRAEDAARLRVEPVDIVVCRAVWSDQEVLRVAAPWIRGRGLLLCLRSEQQRQPTGDPTVLGFEQSMTYRIANERRRRLDVYRRDATS